MRFHRPIVLLLGLTACHWADALVHTTYERFVEHRGKWEALGIKDYEFDYQNSCFCMPEAVAPVTIIVENGAVVQVRHRITGEDITNAPYVTWPTIDSVFKWKDSFVRNHPSHVEFVYDGTYHYPGFGRGDVPMIADEEFTLHITRFALPVLDLKQPK